jgi:hypothetical protein
MSLRNVLGVVAFGSAVALALYGVGCGSSSGGTGGAAGTTGTSGTKGTGGAAGSSGSGGGSKGTGGTSGVSPFEGGDSGGTCEPGSLTGFTPGLNPSAVSVGMCTSAQINSIVADCLAEPADAGSGPCNDLLADAATKTCFDSCVFSNWTGSASGVTYTPNAWGGLVYLANPGETNFVDYGACYANAAPGDMVVQTCAKDIEEWTECQLQACATNCPVPNEMTTPCEDVPECEAAQTALNGCQTASNSGVCKTYYDNVNTDCASVTADSGPIFDCNSAISVLTSTTATLAQVATAFTQYLDIICVAGGIPEGGGGG